MNTIAVQYLEYAPPDATPAQVRERLRQAFERLPISMILTGWDLPPEFEDTIAEETIRRGARLFRWQPWLTGDARTDLPPEWHTIGLDGSPIPGHNGQQDFTFICPNRSSVADFLEERLELIATRGLYQGIFLDRIRFPSPAPNPAIHLGCFCKHCTRLAAEAGLDLDHVRRYIDALLADSDGALRFIRSLLGKPNDPANLLEDFLDFRSRSITRTVAAVWKQAHILNLGIGLDCFSPSLTCMVGQNLAVLKNTSDWIKTMTYPRVFGPAGISFELLGLINWLIQQYNIPPNEVLSGLREASALPIPATLDELSKTGLNSEAIAIEIARGRNAGITNLFAGIALVKMMGIHESSPEQIQSDLEASRSADGLVISWDLWHITLEYLDTVQRSLM